MNSFTNGSQKVFRMRITINNINIVGILFLEILKNSVGNTTEQEAQVLTHRMKGEKLKYVDTRLN